MSCVFLKIKIKSLAAEAKIIRFEERRFPGIHPTRQGLRQHRIDEVRTEARSALLAYGFLRGLSIAQIEGTSHTKPDMARVRRLADKFGETSRQTAFKDAFAAWEEGGAGLPRPAPEAKPIAA